MVQPQLKIIDHKAHGLGWGLLFDLPNNEYAIEHGGGDKGVKTMGVIFPKSKRGMLVFTNSDNGLSICNNIMKAAFDEGQQYLDFAKGAFNPTIIDVPNETLVKYTGTYARSDMKGWNINITKEGSALKIIGDGIPVVDLFSYDMDKFFIKGYGYE